MSNESDHAWKLMSDLRTCVFVTTSGEGFHGRPMSAIVKKDEGAVYFLSDQGSAKDEEVLRDAHVLLVFGNGSSKFVCLQGQASVSSDRALVKRLWNPGAQAFWPNGPDDRNVIAITIDPHHAEYWEGDAGIVGAAKMLVAVMRGKRPDLGEQKTVNL